jgi:hypothetical protein
MVAFWLPATTAHHPDTASVPLLSPSALLCVSSDGLAVSVVTGQFWYYLFNQVGLSHIAPVAAESSFDDWWESVGASVSGEERKGVSGSTGIVVFDGSPPVLLQF